MARAVLKQTARRWAGATAVLALVILHAQAASAQVVCSTAAEESVKTTFRMAMRSPLYLFAKERLGPTAGCQFSKDGEDETLVMSFPHGGTLTVSRSPTIEFASQVLTLGKLEKPVRRPEAIEVLQKTETEETGRDGCGISRSKWRAAVSASYGDVALSGDVCNCKVTLMVKAGLVVGLGLSTAC